MRRFLLIIALVLALAGYAWHREITTPLNPGAASRTFTVEPGMSVLAIGRRLHEMGFVRHPLVFRAYITMRGVGSRLKAGKYAVDGSHSLARIVDLLARGSVVQRLITFPEGKCALDMARIAAGAGLDPDVFLLAARDPMAIRDLDPLADDLEGYLFPDTYDLGSGTGNEHALVARMVERFRKVVRPELILIRERGLTLRETVTLASLVETETGRSEERPRIAAVFLNRLRRGMPLQADPSVIYAMRKAGIYDGNIRKKDLDIESSYNTYRRRGLPPGPIASPGREAILAVLHPAPVKDLYFVSRNDGSHHFSATLREHERAVDRYQRRRANASGG
ncbi:MAG: endolytic transglycosylase MltG [Vicinamibacteria bacterium]|nr:endolytic transglycosylase MltG [Vicinamibacteria bacterium]